LAIKGYVEVVSEDTISGWCYSTDSDGPAVVKLYVDDIFIRSRRADNTRADIQNGGGPAISGFKFPMAAKLLKHLPQDGQVRVVVGDGNFELPFLKGTAPYLHGGSNDNGDTLRSMLSDKWHIDHWCNLQVSFGKDPTMIVKMLDFYCDMKSFFHIAAGFDLYLTGGNLLGLVREKKFLDHDDDVDASFCVRAETPEEAADRFFDVFDDLVPKLYALGYTANLLTTGQFHVARKGESWLDVFLGWNTSDKHWYRFTGAGGYLGANTVPTREIDYLGRRVLIPLYAEKELDLTYGEGWKDPDPHFFWTSPPDIHDLMRRLQIHGAERVAERQRILNAPDLLREWVWQSLSKSFS